MCRHPMKQQALASKQNTSQWIQLVIQIFDTVQSWLNIYLKPKVTLHCYYIWAATWYFQQCGMCDQQSLRSACAYVQSDQSLCQSLEFSLIVKLLTEHHLEFPSLKGGYTVSSEHAHVKMPYCLKSYVEAHIPFLGIGKWCIEAA